MFSYLSLVFSGRGCLNRQGHLRYVRHHPHNVILHTVEMPAAFGNGLFPHAGLPLVSCCMCYSVRAFSASLPFCMRRAMLCLGATQIQDKLFRDLHD